MQVGGPQLGVHHLLERALRGKRAAIYEWVQQKLPIMPPKARHWMPEMIEILKTSGTAGITPRVVQGMADICAFVAGTNPRHEPLNGHITRTAPGWTS